MSQLKPINLPKVADTGSADSLDPLDSRYYDPEIARYLSERASLAYKAYVEAALGYALAEAGTCSAEVAAKIEEAVGKVTAEEVAEEEKATKHDIKALVNVIKKYAGDEAGRYVHFGATSYDIVSTATSLQMKSVISEVVIPRLNGLIGTLAELTERYADTPQIGRTHGQHAVPITFGFALSEYVSRLSGSVRSLTVLSGKLKGKFSGAVGAYNASALFIKDPLEFEKNLLASIGLEPAESSTQIVPPEPMVRLMAELSVVAGVMANLATDMRHLQRTEISEIREKFEPGQTGSSTMAHKRNPVSFENVASLHKQVVAQLVNANLNLISEHQRDLTDSASARFYAVPFAAVAVMIKRLDLAMQKIEVDEASMQRNLEVSGGAIAAEPLYLLLAKYGHSSAHEKSKELAHKALDENKQLVEFIVADAEAKQYWDQFSEQEQRILQKPQKYYLGLASQKAKSIVANSKK